MRYTISRWIKGLRNVGPREYRGTQAADRRPSAIRYSFHGCQGVSLRRLLATTTNITGTRKRTSWDSKGSRLHALLALCLMLFIAMPLAAAIPEAQRNTSDQVTGVKGAYTAEEDVYRVNFSCTDVRSQSKDAQCIPSSA
jgi:hypothetical protein